MNRLSSIFLAVVALVAASAAAGTARADDPRFSCGYCNTVVDSVSCCMKLSKCRWVQVSYADPRGNHCAAALAPKAEAPSATAPKADGTVAPAVGKVLPRKLGVTKRGLRVKLARRSARRSHLRRHHRTTFRKVLRKVAARRKLASRVRKQKAKAAQ